MENKIKISKQNKITPDCLESFVDIRINDKLFEFTKEEYNAFELFMNKEKFEKHFIGLIDIVNKQKDFIDGINIDERISPIYNTLIWFVKILENEYYKSLKDE